MKLPATIYVKIVKENDGTEYLIADGNVESLVLEIGNKIKAGVYHYEETIEVEGHVVIKRKGK